MDSRDTLHETQNKPDVLREFEFYGGCIRVKISVKNTSDLAILDTALELEADEQILHFDRCEPEYPEKKGRILLGNINPNTDRTVAFYLDPLICAKEGTDINCRVSFKDAFGRPDSVQMETLKIKVVCPIFRTEQDINVGRLKELISELQFQDSKVYTLPKRGEISELLRTCRDVVLLHDVRHIKTFKTTDEKTYEAWYYGKTKVTKKDLVIKCAICKDTESIEVFASGNDPGDITGLLAEIGRNLTREFERLGKVQSVFNIHIKNSIIQRSNLLSFCDIDGSCGGNVVIDDSVVQRSNIASWNEVQKKELEEERARHPDDISQIQYWITTSNWYDQHIPSRPCSGAFDRQEKQIWWYYKNRDNVRPGDKAVVYQPGGDVEAGKEKIRIDERVKGSFIGNFTVDKIIEKRDFTVPDICWTEPYDGWLKTVEKGFLWPKNKIIKRKNINDDLLLKITKSPNIGLVFKGKTWIKITKEYYDVVLEAYNKPYKEDRESGVIEREDEQEKPYGRWDEEERQRLSEEYHRRAIEEEEGRQQEEQERTTREREELRAHKEGTSWKGFFAVALLLGVLVLGYLALAPGATEAPGTTKSTPTPDATTSVTQIPKVTQTVSPALESTPVSDQKTFISTIGMEFVLIPAGEFDMGSPTSEKGSLPEERPVHRVKISKPFYMGKNKVTQKQWSDIMGNNPSFLKGDDLPVDQVSWYDIQDFIKQLNEKEGTNKYRLPSEAEWEYSIRAGTNTTYFFGDNISELGDYAWYDGTHPVGQKKPNPWGLYDMHGNGFEWIQDIYHGFYGYNGAPTDGSAWEGVTSEGGVGSKRVLRGSRGCLLYNNIDGHCRSASRDSESQGIRNGGIGFRLVRDL